MSWTLNKKIAFRQSMIWLGVTLFSILFKVIYYTFSHHIYSDYLTFLWIPSTSLLCLYGLTFVLNIDFGEYGRLGLNAGVGTLMVYMTLRGIYEIALILPENSVDVRLTIVLLISSIFMMILGVIFIIGKWIKDKKKKAL